MDWNTFFEEEKKLVYFNDLIISFNCCSFSIISLISASVLASLTIALRALYISISVISMVMRVHFCSTLPMMRVSSVFVALPKLFTRISKYLLTDELIENFKIKRSF